MIGWSNDHRLDSTIRYANAAVRNLQHASSFLFSNHITYDSRYYRSTDAARYYDAFGEMFGGIGGYPIVASPFYHQTTDRLETINHEQIVEICKSTVASMILLASSPAMIKGLDLARLRGTSAEIRREASPESGISSYEIAYRPADNPELSGISSMLQMPPCSKQVPELLSGLEPSTPLVCMDGTGPV